MGEIFEQFVEKVPAAGIVWGILERVPLMNLVVCKVQPSIHSAYQDKKEEKWTSLTAVYDKISRMDTTISSSWDNGVLPFDLVIKD